MLTAKVMDLLAVGIWQRGGGKGHRPKPIKIPGIDDTAETRLGGDVVRTPAEITALFKALETPE